MTPTSRDRIDAARLTAAIGRVPGWEGRAHIVGALSGGITNRNHVVEVDGERFVVRLPGPDTELLEIDRECEHVAASRAAELGIAPEVLGIFDGCLVTRFVAGRPLTPSDVADPETLAAIASILRCVHRAGPLVHSFDAFTVPALHRAAAASRGVAIPPEYTRLAEIVGQIRSAFGAVPDELVPCHNDLLGANFLRDGPRIWLLDWEYAGMNEPTFDLGNLAVNNELHAAAEHHLVTEYFGATSERNSARVRLMKIVSDAREAMWGVVQQGISTLDFDYAGYAAERFDRLFRNASAPTFPSDLTAAAEA